jgi:alpha-galactosidase
MANGAGKLHLGLAARFVAISLICGGCGDGRLTAILPAAGEQGGAPSGPATPEADACTPSWHPLLPPLGWNGWNAFRCRAELDQQKFHDNVDALLSSGLKDAGYSYANLDDCWQAPRGADGTLMANARFPDGIGALGRYVHDRGLKLGIDAHNVDCQRPELVTPGSVTHEAEDATTFAGWGVDYVKYARCGGDASASPAEFEAMQSALVRTGRPMRFTIVAAPFEYWQINAAQQWRTHADIEPSWSALLDVIDTHEKLAAYNGLGGFNDADMLWVGHPALSEAENRAHFSLWAIFASPLLAGNDLSRMSDAVAKILGNRELIALNQDALTLQAVELDRQGDVGIYEKPLSRCGARAVVLLNRGEQPADASVNWQALGLAPGVATIRDLWAGTELDPARDSVTLSVQPHDARALLITGSEPPLPHGTVYLSDLPWSYAANGWGPVERDQELGGQAAGDGQPLSLGGTRYDKGLGTNSPALVRYRVGKRCSTLSAEIGLDDLAGPSGSAVFQVWADGEKIFDSGAVYRTTPARHLMVNIAGREEIRLVVGELDDIGQDHADWADARLSCDE